MRMLGATGRRQNGHKEGIRSGLTLKRRHSRSQSYASYTIYLGYVARVISANWIIMPTES